MLAKELILSPVLSTQWASKNLLDKTDRNTPAL